MPKKSVGSDGGQEGWHVAMLYVGMVDGVLMGAVYLTVCSI